MPQLTRRQFIEDTILASLSATALASAAPVVQAQEKRTSSPNDMIRHAVIGCGIRGKHHVAEFCKLAGVELAYVCDPDLNRAEECAAIAEKAQGRRPTVAQDLRVVFDDRTVDTVSITTPNHWHVLASIWAMQSGKDVYCEKPVSHNIAEGRRIVQCARKLNRICQAGTLSRSNPGFVAAAEYIKSGKLGEVTFARSIVFSRRDSIGPRGTCTIPPRTDFNLWLGPATQQTIERQQFHYDWHWVWDTGNGELGNNNIHKVDVCRWMMGLTGLGDAAISIGGRLGYEDAGETPNTQLVVHTFGPKVVIQEVRALNTEPFIGRFQKVHVIYGTEGIIAEDTLFDFNGKLVKKLPPISGEDHYTNFLKAVRSRLREGLTSEIEEGHYSTALCHLGNISYRLGRPASPAEARAELENYKLHPNAVESLDRMVAHLQANGVELGKTPLQVGALLRPDSRTEKLLENDAANALVAREYRSGFELPAISQL